MGLQWHVSSVEESWGDEEGLVKVDLSCSHFGLSDGDREVAFTGVIEIVVCQVDLIVTYSSERVLWDQHAVESGAGVWIGLIGRNIGTAVRGH